MGFDQKQSVTLRISKGINGKWDVTENDFEDPLASFDNEHDATVYATALSKTKGGTTVSQDDSEVAGTPRSVNK